MAVSAERSLRWARLRRASGDHGCRHLSGRGSRRPSGARLGADELPVGEEHDAVGDRRRRGVVGDHDDRLAELVDRAAQKRQDLAAATSSRGCPVGSSAKTTAGRVTSARATATRCCWPPDSSAGRCVRRSPSPTASMSVSSHSRSGRVAADPQRQDDVLLGGQDRQQVVALEDEADRARRRRVRSRSLRPSRRVPSISTQPAVGRSSPARMCSSVDLPEPEGPMIAVKLPGCERDVDAAQGVDGRRALAVALDEAVAADDGGRRGCRWRARHRLGDEGTRAHTCTIPRARARGDRGHPGLRCRANYGTSRVRGRAGARWPRR